MKLDQKNIRDILALTPMQEGMLYHYLKEPEEDYYFVQLCLEINGELIPALVEKAWNVVIETNEMLRTVYRWDAVKNPTQIILKKHPVQLVVKDFSNKNPDERKRLLEKEKIKDRKNKFNLEEVAFRVTLCKEESSKFLMIIRNHHILYDGWSNGIILREFFNAYDDLTKGRKPVKPVKSKFKEFIKWSRERDIEREEKFWRNYLQGFKTPGELPVKRKRKVKETTETAIYRLRFTKDLKIKLDDFVKKYKITMASLFYSAWGLLLHQYHNSNDVVFGTTISGRSAIIPGIEDIVGLFINTLPLRVQIQSHEEIIAVVLGVNNLLQEREALGNTSLVDIKGYCGLTGSSSEALFDTIVAIENYPLDSRLSGGNRAWSLDLSVHSYSMVEMTHFDLTVSITIFEEIAVNVAYNNDLFSGDTISILAEHFRCIAEDIIRNPGKLAVDINMISAEEKNKIRFEFNNTDTVYPGTGAIQQLFERYAEKSPDNIAVMGMGHAVTYRELNEKAHRLAQLLKMKGTTGDSIVGLMAESSPEMVTGIIGILKAGGAYLPIDPDYPENRIIYMLQDSRSEILLTTPDLSGEITFGKEILHLPDAINCVPVSSHLQMSPAPASALFSSTLNSTCQVSPANLAYIIYTSGSSGRAKGVAVEHSQLLNFIYHMYGCFNKNFNSHDCCLSLTSISFDVSVCEIFLPLCFAARLVLLPGQKRYDPPELCEVIISEKITFTYLPPALLKEVNNQLRAHGGRIMLNKMLVGVEPIRDQVLEDYMSLLPRMRIINGYGPTEATICATTYHYRSHPPQGETVPIGKPLSNNRVLLLDQANRLVPVGVPGELCISGRGISRGYLNKPELTAEKFITISSRYHKSYRSNTSYIIYKTGDLARWLPDGNIEFTGRIDKQVKIRGYRIELGEIESRLLEYENVKEAVVLDRKNKMAENYLCGYIVPSPIHSTSSTKPLNREELRRFLSLSLPGYMIPAYFIQVDKIPRNASGKVDRKALAALGTPIPGNRDYTAPGSDLERKVTAAWQQVLEQEKIGIYDNFFDLGGNSLLIIRLYSKLKSLFKRDIPMTAMFKYPNINSFAKYLAGETGPENDTGQIPRSKKKEKQPQGAPDDRLKHTEIAVIGMAARFPGAENIAQFWENLERGVESITFFKDKELEEGGVDPELLKNPLHVKAKGVITGSRYFDADFFDYSAREAEIMDAQFRVLHECTWEALEDAAYDPGVYEGLIGIYAGSLGNFSWLTRLSGQIKSHSQKIAVESLNDRDFLSSRIAYKLDLKGPAVTVQTACSTSLVAIDTASRDLMDGRCDIALAGGVAISLEDETGYLYQEGMIRSPDGHCRAFDASAEGTVGGNGAAIVVLKRLDEAISDGDSIYAVIKGSAVNNDGSRKVGYTAPSIEGQAGAIRAAQQAAGVNSESIGYVETHGTGTALGDPVEIEALTMAFNTDKKGFCPIGSVKSNIGHLDAAAGAAGFIKTVLALHHKLIPPSLHFKTPNPNIDFANTPFFVNTKRLEWKKERFPRRAGVSSFGIGGTNAHVILEEAPVFKEQKTEDRRQTSGDRGQSQGRGGVSPPGQAREYRLILLSAKTETALERMTRNLARHFKKNPGINLADAAYTLQVGRKAFNKRKMMVCRETGQAADFLLSQEAENVYSYSLEEPNHSIVFMFPGQGAQYVNMGIEIYRTEPVFRREMDRCFDILKPLMGYDIKEILYPHPDCRGGFPNPPSRGNSPLERGAPQGRGVSQPGTCHLHLPPDINQTDIVQPLLFIFEYALAKLMIKWGIKPWAMIGHSIGEYTAACLSGVLSLEDALTLVVWRGRLMQQLDGGSMVGIPLSESDLEPLLKANDKISLAAVNCSGQCVISGTDEAVAELARQLKEKGHTVTLLHTSHAFHSHMMEPMLKPFEEQVRRLTLNPPRLPYISNVTGRWITVGQATSPAYWVRHIRGTVRFSDGLTVLLKNAGAVLVEVGPGRTLSTFVRKQREPGQHQPVVQLVRHPKDKVSDDYFLMQGLGHLWLSGINVDWQGFYRDQRRHRLPLPTYPFDGRYFGNYGETPRVVHTGPKVAEKTPGDPASIKKNKETGKRKPLDEWFYTPSWKRSREVPLYRPGKKAVGNWLFFCDTSGLGLRLLEDVKQAGGLVQIVKIGPRFARLADGIYELNPGQPGDYKKLLKALAAENKVPRGIVHLWNVPGVIPAMEEEAGSIDANVNRVLDLGFYSLIYLAQAIGDVGIGSELAVTVISDGMQQVNDDAPPDPLRATLLGACSVVPEEYPNLRCSSIDIVLPGPGSRQERVLLERLLGELLEGTGAEREKRVVAYRDNIRWVQVYEPVDLEPREKMANPLKKKGVYLVTGGLGGIGLVLAQYMAKSVQARLILTGRSPFPSPEGWDPWISQHGDRDEVSEKIHKLKDLEKSGAEVMVVQADAADGPRMKAVMDEIIATHGRIDGVIHAAGVPDGSLIQARDRASMETVMRPKIQGTLVLARLLARMPGDSAADFFILCSSLTSLLGAFGQVAYTAANRFLDYFAKRMNTRSNTPTVSIAWDAWQEVGMAVKSAIALQSRQVNHPLLDRCIQGKNNQTVYISSFNVKKLWVLDEHRIMGKVVLPGTAYLEMARASFQHLTGSTGLEIREIYFLSPLVVEEDGQREVRTLLVKQGGTFEFTIASRETRESMWQEHARGQMIPLASREIPRYDPAEAEAASDSGGNEQEAIIPSEGFGPHWDNIKSIRYGRKRRLAVLELADDFTRELADYKLHPALLDRAVSYLDERIKEGARYVPFSYSGLKIFNPLPKRVISDVWYIENEFPGKEVLTFGVRVMDEKGRVCVEVDAFMMKRVKADASRTLLAAADHNRNFHLRIASSGNLDTLELKPCQSVKPGPEQVEIEVCATGLNFKEVLFAVGMLPMPYGQQVTFGLECAGRVSGLGEGVEEFAIGQEVIAFTVNGFSRYVVVPVSSVAHKPPQLSFPEAAAIPVAFMTAYYALVTLGQLKKGERVLIHSAAGGVGMAAVNIARWLEAEILATAGNPEKREYLTSLGIKHVLDSRSLDFAGEIEKITNGEGVDVLLNSLPGEYIARGLSIMAPYGRFLEIGVRDILDNSQLSMGVFKKGVSFSAVRVGSDMPGFTVLFREIAAHIEEGDFAVPPLRIFPIDKVTDAFKYMARAKHIGKIVVVQPDRLQPQTGDTTAPGQYRDGYGDGILGQGILPVEGMEVFARVINQVSAAPREPVSQLLVSTSDLTARLNSSYPAGKPVSAVQVEAAKPTGTVNPRPLLSTDYVPPCTKTEKQVARVWQEFLGIEKVGIHDNFFELGASSLDILQISAKLQEQFARDVPLVALYTYPTTAALAGYLAAKNKDQAFTSRENAVKKLSDSKSLLTGTIEKMRDLKND